MSELSVRQYLHNDGSGLTFGYDKSEADKVIAELEESHKKEVGQLLIEIANLKKACNDKDDWCRHTLKQLRRQKYKRCLAMARWSFTKSNYHYVLYRHGEDAKKNNRKSVLYSKRHKRWLAIAEKFKTNSTPKYDK